MYKLIVVLMLIGVIISLFSGLFFLLRDGPRGSRTVKALTVRIGLSMAIFVVLMVGYRCGLIPG